MDPQHIPLIPIDGLTWRRLANEVRLFAASEAGMQAQRLLGLLILLLLVINGLNVIGSYVGRDFMSAIEFRNRSGFIGWAALWIVVFGLCTAVGAFLRFFEERLGLLWREWLTKQLVCLYLEHSVYYRLSSGKELANPDQRIAEDVRAFTSTTLSFALMILNSTLTVLAFCGVLWSISPTLFVVSVLYAVGGSVGSFILGRSLMGLNYSQLDKEANFRAELIHIRENAESVALLHREGRLKTRLMRRIDELVGNFARIIVVNRKLGFYSIGYNYLVQVIPALVVAPLFIDGSAPFGIIAQSAIAFTHLVGAFSLIVTNFPSISSFAAVVARLGSLREAVEYSGAWPVCAGGESERQPPKTVEICECYDNQCLAYEGLSLLAPDGHPLISGLAVKVEHGTRLLISGPNEDAKGALFRATAGIWSGGGEGHIIRPSPRQIYFLPERPYLPPGTLRDLLIRTGEEANVPDEKILRVLQTLHLEALLERLGGLDAQADWHDALSLGEQQLLAFARLLLAEPRFAFLDRLRSSLAPEELAMVLHTLSAHSITYVYLGRSRHGHRDSDDKLRDYDAVLELKEGGDWCWHAVRDGNLVEGSAITPYIAETVDGAS